MWAELRTMHLFFLSSVLSNGCKRLPIAHTLFTILHVQDAQPPTDPLYTHASSPWQWADLRCCIDCVFAQVCVFGGRGMGRIYSMLLVYLYSCTCTCLHPASPLEKVGRPLCPSKSFGIHLQAWPWQLFVFPLRREEEEWKDGKGGCG